MTSVTSPDMVVHVVCDWWPTEESKKMSISVKKNVGLNRYRRNLLYGKSYKKQVEVEA